MHRCSTPKLVRGGGGKVPSVKTALFLALAASALLWGSRAHAQATDCDVNQFAAFNMQADDGDSTDVEDDRHFTINLASDSNNRLRDGVSSGALSGNSATSSPVNYFRIRVPPLISGELLVTGLPRGTLTASTASLCQGRTQLATHDPDTGHFRIESPISSGEYFVVVAGKGGARGTYGVYANFTGLIPTTDGTSGGGVFMRDNQSDAYTFIVSGEGLLTVETTGSVDTIGTVTSSMETIAADDNSGVGNNFSIVLPIDRWVIFTVSVGAQSSTARGNYTLRVDYKPTVSFVVVPAVSAQPTTRNISDILRRGEAQFIAILYFGTTPLLTTIESRRHPSITSGSGTDVKGTLYSPSVFDVLGRPVPGSSGLSRTDSDSGVDSNFLLRAVIVRRGIWILKVDGERPSTTGQYSIRLESSPITAPSMGAATPATLVASTPQNYRIDVATPGLLEVQTLGTVDTLCSLYGPGGQQLATNDTSGEGSNCRIFYHVQQPGFYWVTVQGKTPQTSGAYHIVARLAGVQQGTPGDDRILASLAPARTCPSCPPAPACPAPSRPFINAKGVIEDPPPNGIRGGIGLIRGWVCSAPSVEVRLFDEAGRRVATLDTPYGSSRPDTRGQCLIREEDDPGLTGFGLTWNFNELPEGTYTAEAWAGTGQVAQQIGQTNAFEVVHLTDEPFVRGLAGECRAPDFPAPGATTVLEWEQSLQNFVISGVE